MCSLVKTLEKTYKLQSLLFLLAFWSRKKRGMRTRCQRGVSDGFSFSGYCSKVSIISLLYFPPPLLFSSLLQGNYDLSALFFFLFVCPFNLFYTITLLLLIFVSHFCFYNWYFYLICPFFGKYIDVCLKENEFSFYSCTPMLATCPASPVENLGLGSNCE